MTDYKVITENYIKENAFCMLKNASGVFRYPFVVPGAGYESDLWDWDSFWSSYALIDITEYFKDVKDFDYETRRNEVERHAKGNILNFLDRIEPDGFIPGTVTSSGLFADYFIKRHREGKTVNQCKPVLFLQAAKIGETYGGFDWFDAEKLSGYLDYYRKEQYHSVSGLYFWKNDVMIGIDNNPAVFGRPECSSGDLFLNCFMYAELLAANEVLSEVKSPKSEKYKEWAEELGQAIETLLYNEKDGFYYSADISVRDTSDNIFHKGMKPFWKVLPIKIKMWSGFLPAALGVCSGERARKSAVHCFDEDFICPCGIRTLSKDERMYNTESTSNPSNWLGPVWIVANYCAFKALKNAGENELAASIVKRTVTLLGKDIESSGHMSESYIPETGERMMHNGFLNWDCLVISMLKEQECEPGTILKE